MKFTQTHIATGITEVIEFDRGANFVGMGPRVYTFAEARQLISEWNAAGMKYHYSLLSQEIEPKNVS